MCIEILNWICLPLHGPRCFKFTLWPAHCARIKWHLVAYVWLSVPQTALTLDSSHSMVFVVQFNFKICEMIVKQSKGETN